MIKNYITSYLITLLCANSILFAQNDTIQYSISTYHSCYIDSINQIQRAEVLNAFWGKLALRKNNTENVIRILQIGDSHLQADFISHTIRKELQKTFGNAGRGLISPLKLAKTNEPYSYRFTSNCVWENQKCISKTKKLPIGITGICIHNETPHCTLKITPSHTPDLDYRFDKIQLFQQTDSTNFNYLLKDTAGNILMDTKLDKSYSTLHNLPQSTETIEIEYFPKDSIQRQINFSGISLEKNNPGIIYHSAGINGATYSDYLHSPLFIQQTKDLNLDLIILNLGTNEAFHPKFNENEFYATMDSLIIQLKQINPNASLLLTTPGQSFRNNLPNVKMKLVRNTIIEYANKNNLSLWDLFEIAGSDKGIYQWRKNKLFSKDGIHFSRTGYQLQGEIFLKAIFKAYNEYVSNRHE